MPIYAFECTACGHAFDRLQRLADADPSHCPECDAEAIARQLTAPQFRLAGGGWYETDFKKDGDKKRNIAGDAGESKPGSGDAKATEPAKTDPPAPKVAEGKSAGGTDAGSKTASTPAKSEPARKAEAKPAAGN